MKNILCILMAAGLVSGCATSTTEKDNNARLS